jgi:Dehydrogenase E1 component
MQVAREDRQPTLVEAFTYRFRGHSAADPEVYRTKEEVEEWRKKDPVKVFRDRLLDEQVISEKEVEEMRERIERRVLDAVEFADNSPEPPLESLYDHLYVIGDQVPGWYAVDERTPEPHRGEEEREVGTAGEARKLAEAGAAYAGQQSPRGRNPSRTMEDREAADALEEDQAEGREEESA